MFDFVPTFIMILNAVLVGSSPIDYMPLISEEIPGEMYGGYNLWIVDFQSLPTNDYVSNAGFGGVRERFSIPYGKRNGNTIYWYAYILSDWSGEYKSSWQFNNPNWQYNYIAIG